MALYYAPTHEHLAASPTFTGVSALGILRVEKKKLTNIW
jgi:hypothetical protein